MTAYFSLLGRRGGLNWIVLACSRYILEGDIPFWTEFVRDFTLLVYAATGSGGSSVRHGSSERNGIGM